MRTCSARSWGPAGSTRSTSNPPRVEARSSPASRGPTRTAPSLCLMGHTDVVPVNESGWSRDPFGGELVDGEVWGRGAVDMLNLTASMAVAFRHLAVSGFRPRGDLIYFAVADEESGSAHGMQWMADHEPDAIRADYVLTENGGLHSGPKEQPYISVNVGEKGVAWRRLRVRGTPGHGSMPFKADNALMTAAAVDPAHRRLPPGAAIPRAVDHQRRDARRRRGDQAQPARRTAHRRIPRIAAAPAGLARTFIPARTPRSRATRSAEAGRRA